MQYRTDSMRKCFYICVLAVVMTSVTGCDFFRKLAGRPASDVIEAKRMQIELIREQARLDSIALADSIEAAEKALRDSVDACAFIEGTGVMTFTPARLGGVSGQELEYRYYVVVGSFRNAVNAEALMNRISEVEGSSPVLIGFRNGMVAVGTCPSDKVQDAVSGLKRLRMHPACPVDAWILKNW